jgi:uncharacterized OB-fold protein
MRKGPEAEFHEFLAAGRFMLQHCPASGRYEFYPRVAEPASGDANLEWLQASGLGSVYSVTTVYPKPPAAPYAVALIDLAEGPRMMSTVEGIAPADIVIGLRVRARIAERDGRYLILFEPAPTDASQL